MPSILNELHGPISRKEEDGGYGRITLRSSRRAKEKRGWIGLQIKVLILKTTLLANPELSIKMETPIQ